MFYFCLNTDYSVGGGGGGGDFLPNLVYRSVTLVCKWSVNGMVGEWNGP